MGLANVDRTPAASTAAIGSALVALALLGACSPPDPPPPPSVSIEGLPVSGSAKDAAKAGFTDCAVITKTEMRCRRSGVMFQGFGPFAAAVNLNGRDGASGFDQLTLWHDLDQTAVIPVGNALERRGWRSCFTGEGRRGDQAIYRHPHLPVRVSMDLSYSGKRRLRIIPQWNRRERGC